MWNKLLAQEVSCVGQMLWALDPTAPFLLSLSISLKYMGEGVDRIWLKGVRQSNLLFFLSIIVLKRTFQEFTINQEN